MNKFLVILFGLVILSSNADIARFGKLTSSSNLVTEVLYTDGLEVTKDCDVRFLMGGFKQVGPYLLNGTRLINDDYVKTEVLNNSGVTITNIHVYGSRRINLNISIDNKLKSYATLFIHMPETNDLYKTLYDWHMTISQTNCFSSSSERNYNVVYAIDNEGDVIFSSKADPYYNDDGDTLYYCSFGEIGKRRFIAVSCPLN